jgi:hypothetical protein
LSADLFAEVFKKNEEDLRNIFGPETGSLMKAQSICEENFTQKNMKIDNKMEKLDSDAFSGREKREARQNANSIKN